MKPVIALTDPMSSHVKSANYTHWLTRWIPDAEIRILSYSRATGDPLAGCNGLVVSGGVDVNPALYGRQDAVAQCEIPNPERDAFESRIINQAIEQNIPFLGICRGTQLTNVVLGGTLVPDLEPAGFASHSSTAEGDRVHGVVIEAGTLLESIAGVHQGEVNSAHHQAVERPGKGLRIAARSTDGVIEALEWENPAGRPFFLLVQWHPERMRNAEHELTRTLILHFAEALKRHNTHEDHL